MKLHLNIHKKRLAILTQKSEDCITTVEIQQGLPFAAMAVILIWYVAAPSKISAMGVASLAGILFTAYFWASTLARGVSGQRHLRYTALQVGDELEEEITLLNRSFLPVLWAEFTDQSNIPGYTVASVRAADSKSKIQWRARATCSRRGVFMLGPWEMRMGDPFGICRVRKLYFQRQEILVYPPLAELPPHLLPQSGIQGDHRPLHQPIRADTINATSARPYVPGDPLRHMHWRTTARKDDPFVKLFEPEAAASLWLVADCDSNVHCGLGDRSSFETMILLLASLASEMLHNQLSVGLFANTEEETIVLPQRSQAHLWDILRALAPIQPVKDRPLAQTLLRMQQLLTARNMLVIVTPSLDPGWLAPARRLSGIRATGRVQAILLDPVSFGGEGEAEHYLPVLTEAGISGRVIRQDQIKPLDAVYGEVSRWEFKNLATGRAIVRHAPREAQNQTGPAGSRKWKGFE